MKHIRRRLTVLIYIVIIIACLFSLLFSYLIRANIIMVKDHTRYLFFGFALRDVLLIGSAVVMVVVSVILVTRSTTEPIQALTRATKEIAEGNFQVEVSIKSRSEEFAELQNNFNLMARELQSNEMLKKDFVSSVSHELKTPLSVIGGYAKLLRDGDDLSEEEKKEYLELIVSETARLTTLTSNMLRLSRVSNEKIQLRNAEFCLDEQLREVILHLEPRWTEKDLELEVELEETWYEGDAELLELVWTNLVENAIKYSEPGGYLGVTLTQSMKEVTVTVRDHGCGMSEETAKRVFDPFYQGDTSHRKEGSGLGLALVKRIAELHGGTCSAESTPGEGSAFTVRLPMPEIDNVSRKEKRK